LGLPAAVPPAAGSLEAATLDAGIAGAPTGSNGSGTRPIAEGTVTAERCAWSFVWLAAIGGGFALWGSWSGWSLDGLFAPLLVLVGIAGVAVTWFVASPRSRVFQLTALATALVTTLCNQGLGIHNRRYFTTDSAAFNQVGAHILMHGADPYAATLGSAARLLKAPAQFWTYLVGGGHVDHVSYPAGSILLQVPALALGFHHDVVDWTDLYAWIIAVVLIFVLLPVPYRWVAPLLAVGPLFSPVFGSGGTDSAFLPFLVLALWRWDRFGLDKKAGLARWIGPVALGLACSIKQTPWFCVPFLAIGIALEAKMSGRRVWSLIARYLGIVSGIFAVVNLPFVIWSPAAWARGAFLPFVDPLVADGQGLVTLALHGIVRGVSLPWLSVAGVLVVLAELAALVVWYPRMKRIWILLLPLAFFVATRSLSTYLVDLYPAAIVAVVTVGPAAGRSSVARSGSRRVPAGVVVLVPAVAAVCAAVIAFWSAPLQVGVSNVQTATGLVRTLTLHVHNSSGQSVTPHFMVQANNGGPDGFWSPLHGNQVVIGPHASAIVTLRPQTPFGSPSPGSHWIVEAYTSSPEALSTSPLMSWAQRSGDRR
jgi:uncharacterized membrane protein